MIELTPGTTYVLEPADHLLRLIQQYDYFTITYGAESFLQIRVPTKWVRLEKGLNGFDYLTCRDKRKRDGHLFEIYGNKFFFETGYNVDHLSGKLKVISAMMYFSCLCGIRRMSLAKMTDKLSRRKER